MSNFSPARCAWVVPLWDIVRWSAVLAGWVPQGSLCSRTCGKWPGAGGRPSRGGEGAGPWPEGCAGEPRRAQSRMPGRAEWCVSQSTSRSSNAWFVAKGNQGTGTKKEIFTIEIIRHSRKAPVDIKIILVIRGRGAILPTLKVCLVTHFFLWMRCVCPENPQSWVVSLAPAFDVALQGAQHSIQFRLLFLVEFASNPRQGRQNGVGEPIPTNLQSTV